MLVNKENMKKAMRLNAGLQSKLNYKAALVRNLTDRIEGIDKFSSEYVGTREKLFNLRRDVQEEMLSVIGAMASEYRTAYGKNLFSEFVDYKNYKSLKGDTRIKTVGQMCEILRLADECCREIWADYLEAEGDTYMIG